MDKRAVTIMALLAFSRLTNAQDFYVSPQGNDQANGLTAQANGDSGPFRSLQRAQLAIRDLKKAGQFTAPVTVHILAGEYILSKPLEFDIRDSGFAERPIQWQGEPGTQVTISAGMPISCSKRDATYWDCPLEKLPASTSYPDQGRIKGNGPKFELFVNGQKLQLARWPNTDWAHIKLPIDQKTQFSVMETLPELSGDVSAAQVHIFAGNDWYDQYLGVETINQVTNAIKLSDSTAYPLDSGRRFYLQNLPEFLNAPGEWIYDASGKKLSFIPPTAMTPTSFALSSLPKALTADGVNYLSFKNLSIQHATGNAITLKNANHLVLDHLEINNIGGKGVVIENGQNVHVINSHIHHTGAHGIAVSGGDKKTLQAAGHLIHNNHIHHMGTTIMTSSNGIEVNGVGSKVSHNLLEQGPSIGIQISGNEHLLEKNELHHLCLQSSDCGAFYSGRDWSARGNIFRNNYIHDIIGYGLKSVDVAANKVVYESPAYAIGVYLDDGASGFNISGNIFENIGAVSLHIHGGRDNKIDNNYFKTNDFAIWVVLQAQMHVLEQNKKNLEASPYKTSLWQQRYPELATPIIHADRPEGNTIERNIIVTTKADGYSLRYFAPMNSTTIANNLIWSTSGKLAVDYNIIDLNNKARGVPWSQWIDQKVEHGSIVADPCVSVVNNKMITCPGSPIKEIGFQPLPADIGLIP